MSLLAQIAIFLAAAVIAIPIFRRFKLGSVLGYLTAGIIIGPASLGLISSVETTAEYRAVRHRAADVCHWLGVAALEPVGAAQVDLRLRHRAGRW